MEREEARKATSELNAGLGARFTLLLQYIDAKERGGWGWGADYDHAVSTGCYDNKYAFLKGHYSMLLDLALDLIPPAYIKALRNNRA